MPPALATRERLSNPLELVYINHFPWGLERIEGEISSSPPPPQSPWEMGVSKLALREASHDLRAPGSEPSWVASQLEALPARLLLSSQLPHINKWTTMQIQVLLPTDQIIIF